MVVLRAFTRSLSTTRAGRDTGTFWYTLTPAYVYYYYLHAVRLFVFRLSAIDIIRFVQKGSVGLPEYRSADDAVGRPAHGVPRRSSKTRARIDTNLHDTVVLSLVRYEAQVFLDARPGVLCDCVITVII